MKSNKNISDLQAIQNDELKNSQIIIYGTGIYGTLLYTYLSIKGLKDNILCFTVSEKTQEYFFEKKIYAFDELHIDIEHVIVIAAVGPRNIDAIWKKIKQRNVHNCYWFSRETMQKVRQEIFDFYQRLPIQKNKILFYCYEGMGYRCNCKYIAEKLLEKEYPVDLVWVVSSMENKVDIPETIRVVLWGTEEYYKELYTSSVVIENDGNDSFAYKRQGQFCINTWHGYGPFKKVSGALPQIDKEGARKYYSYYDLFLTASTFYSQVYRDSFQYTGEIMECGAPRNDVFFTDNHIKEKIYDLYHIPADKGIVLYAPTFRYDKIAAFDKYDLNMQQTLDALKKRFHKDYVWMYRFHHQLYKTEERVGYYAKGIDVTLYPDIQELLVAADIVITDYSSLMWDFSLQRKPVFLYQKDLEKYTDDRGFYAPVSEWPYPQAHSQEELFMIIESFDNESYIQNLDLFFKKYGSCDKGKAAECIVKRIMSEIEKHTG